MIDRDYSTLLDDIYAVMLQQPPNQWRGYNLRHVVTELEKMFPHRYNARYQSNMLMSATKRRLKILSDRGAVSAKKHGNWWFWKLRPPATP